MRFFTLTLTISFVLLQMTVRAQTDSFIVDGVYRNYILHLPVGYNGSHAYPLVLNLHGYTSNAGQEEFYTQMDVSSDANGYIVVYPNGISNYWNSWGAAGVTGADDVKFLTELLDTISAHYNVNPKRLYSCGMSNGGYMSYSLACSIADKLAAIASVSGTMSNYTYSTCDPARKIPVMHIHGTTDPTVDYNNGAPNSIGVEQTIAFWRDTLACQNVTDTVFIPNTNAGDSCTVQKIRYATCANGSDILFYKIVNGGHTWAGSPVSIPTYGHTNRDMNATDEIWAFFNRYTLDGPTTGIEEVKSGAAITVYPNPAGNTLNISTNYEVMSADIYDATGKMVISSVKTKTLNVAALEAGMYVVKICYGQGATSVTKIVKQ